MRSFALSLALLLLLISGLGIYFQYVKKESGRLLTMTEAVEESLKEEEWEKADRDLSEMKKAWEETSPKLALFTDHSLLDEILTTVSEAEGFLLYREAPELMAKLETLRTLFDHIPTREKLSLYNIF